MGHSETASNRIRMPLDALSLAENFGEMPRASIERRRVPGEKRTSRPGFSPGPFPAIITLASRLHRTTRDYCRSGLNFGSGKPVMIGKNDDVKKVND